MKLLNFLTIAVMLLISACTSELTASGFEQGSSDQQTVHYRLVAVPLEEASLSTQKPEPRPFRLRGRTLVVDKDGNEVGRAPDGRSIAEIQTSPNRQWALLYFGDAQYAVTSVDGLKGTVGPPIRPDAPADATGFSWFILDDKHLIGQADLPSLEPTEGLTASEADGLPPRGTLVYIYTITTGAMAPVEIDDSVPRPFGISTDSYGNLIISPLLGLDHLGMKVLQIPEP